MTLGIDRHPDITFYLEDRYFRLQIQLRVIVQLKPMIEVHFSGRIVSSGISDVVFASVYSEKTRLTTHLYHCKISSTTQFSYD